MYPRTNYEMTEEDLKELLKACRPTPVIMVGGYMPASPQENANDAWKILGKKMGFEWDTVRPIDGKGQRFFSAVPSETEAQREERLKKEAEEKQANEIKELEREIEELNHKLQQVKERRE